MDFQQGILGAVGNTPLVRLGRLFRSAEVYAKLELLNPSGSAKDRPALRMIRQAWQAGKIGPGSVVIESSSGNLAISLATICNLLGLRFISVIDPRTTENNVRILKAAGAEIELVRDPDPTTGEYLPARLRRVQQLLKEISGSYWPNQYGNPDNYLAHYHTTMKEIIDELGRADFVIGAVSTCGTLRGCAEYVRDRGLATRIVGVDAEGSVIFGRSEGKRRFPGLGAGIVPPFCTAEFADRVVHVSDREIVAGCRLLAREESILAGASSGAVIAAAKRIEPDLAGAVVVVIIHDRGERYLDSVYSDEWIAREFGGSLPEITPT
jgi:cysteine synthase A